MMNCLIRSLARTGPRLALPVVAIGVVFGLDAAGAQRPDPLEEMERRAQERRAQERLEGFVEDTYEFFELSCELVSFRVHPNMTQADLDLLAERAQEVEDQAGRLLSFVRDVAPFVRGRTEGLWVIFDPPDEDTTLQERLTLILALVNRLSPKLDQVTAQLAGDTEPTVSVEDLLLEASAPYFVVGGLEELRSMTEQLRESL
jgi:hypothetical protein